MSETQSGQMHGMVRLDRGGEDLIKCLKESVALLAMIAAETLVSTRWM
jgi:hypothetical protein